MNMRSICRATCLACILWACAGPAPTPTGTGNPSYTSLEDAMSEEINPLVEDILLEELNKDAAAVDFAAIEPRARSVALLFRSASDAKSPLYLEDESSRAAAGRAADWFTQIADAAGGRQQMQLVALYGRKQEICTQCHD